jgi:uncharacterized membrane protein
MQIAESFAAYGRHTGLRLAVVYGGVSQRPQEETLRKGVDVLVATLSATSPVIILPLLWLRTGQRPRALAWAGAATAVAGLALIFLR